ncbi:hypothetical protein EJC47_07730 [Sphingomonas sp. TF3]|uniref:hypothetical protein n=1 Tax=Sphingomonas sp. TF3 TaxID=2495580 RepID=UPI000F945DF0|nr:hypothetical protein [Sphingomonas sp. TF3]RUN76970.1 hypothetical protein EJC47_07730 [Sphingomonas sp. TF3]
MNSPTASDSDLRVKSPSLRCFTPAKAAIAAPVYGALPEKAAHALAVLLPILGCGEEAAGLAFYDLADGEDPEAGNVLRRVAAEEQVHDGLIQALAAGLPAPPDQTRLRAMSRRFHLELGRGDSAIRLARIAALDSAVCLLLSRLLRPGTPLAGDAALAPVLRRIARDEARHVQITRELVISRMSETSLKIVGTMVRERLGALLVEASDAFEALSFDPHWLQTDVARLPAALYHA